MNYIPDPGRQWLKKMIKAVNPDPDPRLVLSKQEIAIYLSVVLHKRTSKLQEKTSALKREHPALQNMKFLCPFGFI